MGRIAKKIRWMSFAGFALLAGCAGNGIRVESQPAGADVFVSTTGQAPRKIGQTPYTVTDSHVGPQGTGFQISVAKEGFQTESVLVPPSAVSRSGNVFVTMREFALPAACVNQEDALQKVARGVAEAQSLIKAKRLDEAERFLISLTTQFSTVSVLYDLLGNVYYLRKDLDKALSAYKRSYDLFPNNPETSRVIGKLEEIRGGKR